MDQICFRDTEPSPHVPARLLVSGRLPFAAVFTNAIDLKGVTSCRVAVSAANFLLQLLHFAGKKFDGATAFRADHMVMTAPVVLMLVTGNAVVEGDFAGQAALGQQLECAVDGGVADASIFLLDEAMKFVGREVVAGFEKRAQNRVALRRLLQSDAFEVLVENLLGLAHHLARDGGLVVDSFLKHEESE
jgi:predicted cupin superfamily sugar epimerase